MVAPTPNATHNFEVVNPLEQGWWYVLAYEEQGMQVAFDAVNGASTEEPWNTPTYAIDTTSDDSETQGLYLVASGCLVDVEGFARQLEATHASGQNADELTLEDLVASGSVLPLTENSMFRLPPQEVGQSLAVLQGNEWLRHSQNDSAPIRRIEEDLRPYDVTDRNGVIRFAGKMGIQATRASNGKDGKELGSPITRAAKRINYALVPVEVQEQMRPPLRPLNTEDVIDEVRVYLTERITGTYS